MRLFFALWPEEAVRRSLWHATRALTKVAGGRAVAEEQLHLTLAFLGEVPEHRVPELERIGSGTAAASEPFELELRRPGVFERPRVFWLGPHITPPACRALATRLRAGLAEGGFRVERRPFAAHLTLARKLDRPEKLARRLQEGALPAPAPVTWPVRDMVLVASETAASGPVYRVLYRWALSGGGPGRAAPPAAS